MNKKGFSLIEVMTTFVLISIILVMLIELLLSLKEVYKNGEIKTTLLINQANIERKIYNDIFDSSVLSIATCGSYCLNITTDHGVKQLKKQDNSVIYDGYSIDLPNGTTVYNASFSTYSKTVNNKSVTIYAINLPIHNSLLDEEYGIHVITQVGPIF